MQSNKKDEDSDAEEAVALLKELNIDIAQPEENVESQEGPVTSKLFTGDSLFKLGDPFENLVRITHSVLINRIEKRILQAGEGSRISSHSDVTIDYEVFMEGVTGAIDFTGNIFPSTISVADRKLGGLTYVLQSMQCNEISQFLILFDFAYGKSGWTKNIKPTTVILVVMHIKNVVSPTNLTPFSDSFKQACELATNGDYSISKARYRMAIRDYTIAVEFLRPYEVFTPDEEEQRLSMLLPVYTNLVLLNARTKDLKDVKDVIYFANELYKLCEYSQTQVPVNVYIQHACTLMFINNFDDAEILFNKAQLLDPENLAIPQHISKLKELRNAFPPPKKAATNPKPIAKGEKH